jgi:hypothetical protein
MSKPNTNIRFNQENLSRRGIPAHASAQRNDVLRLLREAKARGQGLRRADAIFQHRITQVGARVHELERMGYVIRHDLEPGARFVTYFLVSEPAEEKPLPDYRSKQRPLSKDWYEQATGRKRPSWQPRPFSEKRMAQDDCFVLTPPEPRP